MKEYREEDFTILFFFVFNLRSVLKKIAKKHKLGLSIRKNSINLQIQIKTHLSNL